MNTQEQRGNAKISESTVSTSSSSGPELTTAREFHSHETERSGLGGLTDNEIAPSSQARKPTGPRTVAGKQKSRYNALKHGIYSQAVVLEGEPRPQYESLLATLLEHFQPVGSLEEVLVEKLAMLLWRHRRLVIVEGAEIRRGGEFLQWDKAIEMQQEVDQIEGTKEELFEAGPGLILRVQNSTILARCIE